MLDKFTFVFQIITTVFTSPVREGTSLSPTYTHNWVFIIRWVPEVFIVHWLVEAVRKVMNPNERIWIHVDRFLFKERRAIRRCLGVFDIIAVTEQFAVSVLIFVVVFDTIQATGRFLFVNPKECVIQLACI